MRKKIKKSFLCILSAIILVLTITYNYKPLKVSAAEINIVSGGIYYIRNVKSNKLLTVKDGGTSSGTKVVIYSFLNTDYQKWKITSLGNGYYTIRPLNNLNNALDVYNNYTSDWSEIDVWNIGSSDYFNTDEFTYAQWKIIPNGDGSYRLTSKASQDSKFLDCFNGYTNDNTQVIQYSWNGDPNMRWILEPFVNVQIKYDEGYSTRNGGNSAIANLQIYTNIVSNIYYSETGIRMRFTVSNYHSILDDCHGSSFDGCRISCDHTTDDLCSNDYSPTNLYHHKNFSKLLNYNIYTYLEPKTIRLLYTGHNTCEISDSLVHYYQNADDDYRGATIGPYVAIKVFQYPQDAYYTNICLMIHEMGHCFGLPDHSFNGTQCIMGKQVSDRDFFIGYNNGTYTKFWCDSCKATLISNSAQYS